MSKFVKGKCIAILVAPVHIFKISLKIAPKIMGILIINEKSSAACLSKPLQIPAAYVLPLRDIPGSTANACPIPIKILLFIPTVFVNSFLLFCTTSAMISSIPEVKNAIANAIRPCISLSM